MKFFANIWERDILCSIFILVSFAVIISKPSISAAYNTAKVSFYRCVSRCNLSQLWSTCLFIPGLVLKEQTWPRTRYSCSRYESKETSRNFQGILGLLLGCTHSTGQRMSYAPLKGCEAREVSLPETTVRQTEIGKVHASLVRKRRVDNWG